VRCLGTGPALRAEGRRGRALWEDAAFHLRRFGRLGRAAAGEGGAWRRAERGDRAANAGGIPAGEARARACWKARAALERRRRGYLLLFPSCYLPPSAFLPLERSACAALSWRGTVYLRALSSTMAGGRFKRRGRGNVGAALCAMLLRGALVLPYQVLPAAAAVPPARLARVQRLPARSLPSSALWRAPITALLYKGNVLAQRLPCLACAFALTRARRCLSVSRDGRAGGTLFGRAATLLLAACSPCNLSSLPLYLAAPGGLRLR